MPFIEGIGDEVTIILGGFFICIILMFAWLSTHTADIPLLREVGVIVVELSQRRSRTQNAVSEDPVVREDADGSIERENTAENVERQHSEAEGRGDGESSESSELLGGQNNNTAVGAHTTVSPLVGAHTTVSPLVGAHTTVSPPVGAHTTVSPPVGAHSTVSPLVGAHTTVSPPVGAHSTVSPPVAEDVGSTRTNDASSGLVPQHAEADESRIPDQAAASSSSQPVRRTSGDHTSTDSVRDSEGLVPKATVVVDDSKGFTYPSEEEIRQRRVQYFQANKSTEGGNGATQSSADDNKPSSLSEFSDPGSDHTRQLRDNSPSSYHPSTAGTTQEDAASRVSHPAADSSSAAAISPDQGISDSQIINRGENLPSSKIRVKLKYMNETQRIVYAEPLDTIGDFRRTHFQAELQDNKWVRFIYNGQDLRDDARTLQACSVGDNCTMHCLITAQSQSHVPRTVAAEEDEDSFMGAMMYPLFTVIIMIVWYFRFTYRQYFSAMSTVCLIGISFLLVLSYISSLRTSDRIAPQRRLSPTTPPPPEGVELREEHQHVD